MNDRFPEFMQQVEEQGVRYIRIMPCEDDPSSAIGRGWKSTFLTDSRGIFARFHFQCIDRGSREEITFSWIHLGVARQRRSENHYGSPSSDSN